MSEKNNNNSNNGHYDSNYSNGFNNGNNPENGSANNYEQFVPANLPISISSSENFQDTHTHTERRELGTFNSNTPENNNHENQDHHTQIHPNHQNEHSTYSAFEHTDHAPVDTLENSESNGSKFLKILMIIGILIVLFFISIGIVKIVPKAIGSLSSASVYISSIFSREGIELTADKKEVKNDDTLTISWKNTSKQVGIYSWSFKCIEGVTVLYKSGNGSMQPVFCETSFPLPENTNTFPFVIKTENEKEARMLMTLSLFNKETKEMLFTDTSEITVLKKSVPVKEETNTNNPTYNPDTTLPNTESTSTKPQNTSANIETTSTNKETKQTTVSVGPTDMSINLLSANAIQSGTINTSPISNVGSNDKIVIRFKVANLGTNYTGTWQITALLPTLIQSERTFVSKIEPSLAPKESHEMTLMFDSFDATKNEIVITIENINDTNSVNNIIRIPISGSRNTNDNSYSGSRPDLEVKIISVGTIDRYNNFYATNNLDTNDEIAVKFQVQNIGGSTSGHYDMKVKVPTEDNSDTKIFRSLSPLAPGVRTEFTVNFENPDSGRNIISIELDPDNDIRENKETNNKDSRTINIDN